MSVDVKAAMAKRGFTELTDEDLNNKPIDEVKCRACSGYGNCGYKTFRLYKDQPHSICNLRFQKIKEEAAGTDASDADVTTDADENAAQ